MSLLATIKNALGLVPPVRPGPAGAFRLSATARAQVDRLPKGRALHVATVPVAGGYTVRTWEGNDDLVPDDAPVRIAITETDAERLRGLVLAFDGDRFVTSLELQVAARETPNPETRKYEASRYLAYGTPQSFLQGDADPPPLAARVLAIPKVQSVLFREHTVSVEREMAANWGPIDRGVEAALREHFALCGEPLREAAPAPRDGDLEREVLRVMQETILPKVHRDGGDLQLQSVEDGIVRLKLVGACGTCPASQITLKVGVERTLKEALPGRIRGVQAV